MINFNNYDPYYDDELLFRYEVDIPFVIARIIPKSVFPTGVSTLEEYKERSKTYTITFDPPVRYT